MKGTRKRTGGRKDEQMERKGDLAPWLQLCRLTEIGWRDETPVCFWGFSGNGNVCEEPAENFVGLPLEPLLWRIYGLLKRWRLIK